MNKPKARRIYTLEDLSIDGMTNMEIMFDLQSRANSMGAPAHLGALSFLGTVAILEYQAIVLRAEDIRAANVATNQSMLRVVEVDE